MLADASNFSDKKSGPESSSPTTTRAPPDFRRQHLSRNDGCSSETRGAAGENLPVQTGPARQDTFYHKLDFEFSFSGNSTQLPPGKTKKLKCSSSQLKLSCSAVQLVNPVFTSGESAVGKSSLVLRFVKGQFHEFQEVSREQRRKEAESNLLFSSPPLELHF